MESSQPWVSFCISTFKRPEILRKQLLLLLQQSFDAFEVIVSDNDPEASAQNVITAINDPRLKYYHNAQNLGMMRSFNKSIDRAGADFIVMVTDDDPVDPDFLSYFYKLWCQQPDYSVYGGFLRSARPLEAVEMVPKESFISEILDPDKTKNLLWSSCILRKSDVLKIGKIPDYGSPHLADHALLAKTGSVNGGIIINKMFSSLTSHGSNFSKSNFSYYVDGCKGFYQVMMEFAADNTHLNKMEPVVIKHISHWFIVNWFALKKYFTVKSYNAEVLKALDVLASQMLAFPFMKKTYYFFHTKKAIFRIKKFFRLLK